MRAAKALLSPKGWLALRMSMGAIFWLTCFIVSLIFEPWGAWFFAANGLGFIIGGCLGIGNALFEYYPPKRGGA
jgi:hypothetical protein